MSTDKRDNSNLLKAVAEPIVSPQLWFSDCTYIISAAEAPFPDS